MYKGLFKIQGRRWHGHHRGGTDSRFLNRSGSNFQIRSLKDIKRLYFQN